MTELRVTRRGVMAGAVASAAFGAGIRPVWAQTPNNVLVIGHIAELQTLDPAQAVTISDFRILCNIYEGLLRYKDGSLDVEPALAESWTLSPELQDLHVQAAPGRQIPRRDRLQRRVRQIQL